MKEHLAVERIKKRIVSFSLMSKIDKVIATLSNNKTERNLVKDHP